MVAGWEAQLAGQTGNAEQLFNAARELAERRGFRFISAAQVARLPDDEFLARVRAARKPGGGIDPVEARAVLGVVSSPGITVERALELFWELADDRTIGKSEDQLRRWKHPRIRATRNFVDVVGNRELSEITADDMIKFRSWWSRRMKKDGLTANSANKDITHISDVWRTVNKLKRLGLDLPLSDLAFRETERRDRPPFSSEWIQERILSPNALDGLNTQARCILLGMVNTGCRPSELAGLLPEHIRLDADVPHISIEAVGRQLKTAASKRLMPLVGVSLEAIRECSTGFPRYRNKDQISNVVNKFMRENGLLESDRHVLYSLRHSFEDRMLAVGVDERIRQDLFGHALNRERYGSGATLEHKYRVVQSVAFE